MDPLQPSRWGRVLVVDDEPLVARVVARALGASHEVETATSGAEALARLDAGRSFDAVVCDISMPGMSGVDLHRAVAARWPDLAEHFVFLTGGACGPVVQAYLARSGATQLGKPFETAALRALVAAHVVGPVQLSA